METSSTSLIPTQLTNNFSNYFHLPITNAKEIIDKIIGIQRKISDKNSYLLEKSENYPYEVLITQHLFFCILKQLDEGSYSLVYKVAAFAIKTLNLYDIQLSQKEKIMVLKKGKNRKINYNNEKENLESFALKNVEGADYTLCTFVDQNGSHYSLNRLYQTNLLQTSFHQLNNPLNAILEVLISVVNFLQEIHNQDCIHRDIKGANILVTIKKDKTISALTDFTFFRKEETQGTRTIATAKYLDPQMFGNAEETLLNQKVFKGRQNKEGDIYALGITIIYDLLIDFFLEKSSSSQNKAEINRYIDHLNPTSISGPLTDAKIKNIGLENPHRAVYFHPFGKNTYDSIYIFPSLENCRKYLSSIIELSKDCFTSLERDILHKVSTLACHMQRKDLQRRPNAKTIETQLKRMQLLNNYHSLHFFRIHEREYPLLTILQIFQSCISQISATHNNGYIYRDIKASNIVAFLKNDHPVAYIAEFGLTSKVNQKVHFTNGTPQYLDPQMFGTVEKTLLNQKNRRGCQTQQGDIYSFALSIIYDVLLPFIKNKTNPINSSVIQEYLHKIQNREIEYNENLEMLEQIACEHPFRATYNIFSDTIYIHAVLEQMKTLLINSIDLLDNCLDDKEIEGFKEFIHLLCEMQEIDLEKRPSAAVIEQRVSTMISKQVEEEQRLQESRVNRKRKAGEEIDLRPSKEPKT